MSGTPRIPPVSEAEEGAEVQELLELAGPMAGNNIFKTVVRHPRLYKKWLPWGTAMLYAKLPPRDREILILRAAHRCESHYEWVKHVEIGRGTGLTDTEIERIKVGPEEPEWSSFDAVLVRAVDELLEDHVISDSTWEALETRYDERLMMEVPIVVGHYFTMGLVLNALRIQLEADGQ